jgi:multidrug resistance efflux pump
MKGKSPQIVYSDPVKDIMGTPPRRIISSGTTVIFVVFILFLAFSWFLKYPDVVPSPVEITTENPPVILVSRISGKIKHMHVSDKSNVVAGQMLAVMETAASMDDFSKLKSLVNSININDTLAPGKFPAIFQLGELQQSYATFIKDYSGYYYYIKNDSYGSKANSVKDEISGILAYIERLKVKEKLYNENLVLETKKYRRDSLLNKNNVIPDIDMENSHQAYLMQRIELQQVRLDYSAKTIELAERRQLLQDYIIKRSEDRESLQTALNESFQNLKAQIDIWEKKYILISPIAGIITFTKYWSENQTVTEGEQVMSIIPDDQGAYLGRINLKMQRSGKVKTGQYVNIKFTGYPYLEYGMVRGIIKTKSLVPSGDAYVIEIELPNGLTTLYGKKLDFSQNMIGTAEIITENIRLLQKIMNPFKYIISKNKL